MFTKLTFEQIRRLKQLTEDELERQDLTQDKEYIEELELILEKLPFVQCED